jgi:hypothetical protein
MIIDLMPHTTTPPGPARSVRVTLNRSADTLSLEYRLEGDLAAIAVPAVAPPVRTDNLWHRTCFEAFLGLPDGSYREYNFSPSGAWAAYHFDGFRLGMKDLASPDLTLNVQHNDGLVLAVSVPLEADLPIALGLSTIVELPDGTKSFWAVAHPPGPPEFHHPACRAVDLAPIV